MNAPVSVSLSSGAAKMFVYVEIDTHLFISMREMLQYD